MLQLFLFLKKCSYCSFLEQIQYYLFDACTFFQVSPEKMMIISFDHVIVSTYSITAFRARDQQSYKEARARLRRDAKMAKLSYQRSIEAHFNSNNSRGMWQGIKFLIGYNNSSTATMLSDSTLLDTPNQFFTRFDHNSRNQDTFPASSVDHNMLQLQPNQVSVK